MRNEQTKKTESAVKTAKGLADISRMRIMGALIYHGELCVCQITEFLGLAISTVSRHISILQRGGLVISRKDGRWVYYKVSEDIPSDLKKWLEKEVFTAYGSSSDRRKLDSILSSGRPDVLCGDKTNEKT